MKRYQLGAYSTLFVGIAVFLTYGISEYIQRSHAYQIANDISPKIQNGSFWLTVNPESFMYPGVALVIIGMAMIFYHATKSLSTYTKQRDAQTN